MRGGRFGRPCSIRRCMPGASAKGRRFKREAITTICGDGSLQNAMQSLGLIAFHPSINPAAPCYVIDRSGRISQPSPRSDSRNTHRDPPAFHFFTRLICRPAQSGLLSISAALSLSCTTSGMASVRRSRVL